MTSRLATTEDIPALVALMQAAIGELQRGYLDEAQIDASRAILRLDRRLIEDGTYFVVECDGELAGCGGWSGRGVEAGRGPALVCAMYTHPRFTRRGVGRLILGLSESAAAAEGFTELQLMSTLAGQPLYSAAGFELVKEVEDGSGGTPVPMLKMRKAI